VNGDRTGRSQQLFRSVGPNLREGRRDRPQSVQTSSGAGQRDPRCRRRRQVAVYPLGTAPPPPCPTTSQKIAPPAGIQLALRAGSGPEVGTRVATPLGP